MIEGTNILTKKCPACGYKGQLIDVVGYLLQCPECERVFNEDEI